MSTISETPDFNAVRQGVLRALTEFNGEKSYLYSVNIYEPTLSHRIALYLESEFEKYGYIVDCEYNKNLGKPKMNNLDVVIRPDILVHKRGTEENLIVIELKKAGVKSKSAQLDIKKLQSTENLNYSYKLFIGVQKKRIDVVWVNDENITLDVV